jgi:RNA polymerase sigma-70 factor (ECF subfamily)
MNIIPHYEKSKILHNLKLFYDLCRFNIRTGGADVQDDKDIIKELLDGSKSAMELLVNRYYKQIFSYVYRNTGQYHTSYDLTQEVFIKMMKGIYRFDNEEGSFKNWIFKIALNTVRDYFKGKSYREYKEISELDEGIRLENGKYVDLVSHLSQRQDVKNAILGLPEYQRNVIILRFYNDMKIKDIAKVMDTNESTVKSRLRQAIEKIRNILSEGGEDNETRLGV